MASEVSCTVQYKDYPNGLLSMLEELTEHQAMTILKFAPYGDKYWFLPIYSCKATPIDISFSNLGMRVDWLAQDWSLVQDERWFARLLQWLYIDVWLWFRSIYKRM